jgi:hypothetical protein
MMHNRMAVRLTFGLFGALVIAGCSGSAGTSNVPAAAAIITRGYPCIQPSQASRRVKQWVQLQIGHCGGGALAAGRIRWSSNGGVLRVREQGMLARFESPKVGTFTVTAKLDDGSVQATVTVYRKKVPPGDGR